MILKIETPIGEGWQFYDHISGLHVTRERDFPSHFAEFGPVNVSFRDEELRMCYESFYQTTESDEGRMSPGTAPPARGVFFSFYEKDQTCHECWANTKVYLLNDEGKTIERLN